MKYATEPTVQLISRTQVDWNAVAEFLESEELPPVPESIRASEDESAAVVEISARICYMSYGNGRRDIEEFIHNLLSKGDGSVFEHVNYGFMITGVSRALTHELVRHRAGFAYSQRSQRFVEENDANFVIPPALDEDRPNTEKARSILKRAVADAHRAYGNLVSELSDALPKDQFQTSTDRRKAIRQAARSILPNATETKIFVTANVRAWRHFIEMRGAAFADWEIRRLSIIILNILKDEAPLLFGDFTIEDLPDGTQTAKPKYPKV